MFRVRRAGTQVAMTPSSSMVRATPARSSPWARGQSRLKPRGVGRKPLGFDTLLSHLKDSQGFRR